MSTIIYPNIITIRYSPDGPPSDIKENINYYNIMNMLILYLGGVEKEWY